MLRSPKHESHFWCTDDMVRAWVASPLPRERGRVRMASRQPTRPLDKSNPSPSSSPLLRRERRQDHSSGTDLDFDRLTNDVISSEANISACSCGARLRNYQGLKAWPRGLRPLRCSFASLRMTILGTAPFRFPANEKPSSVDQDGCLTHCLT
jgi:hypothetical protein